MITVSNEFKTLMEERQNFKENAEITFSDGTVLELYESEFSVSNNMVNDGADSSSFPLGVAICRNIQIELINDDGGFNAYDFTGAKIRLYLTFELSETIEKIEYGTFTVTNPATYGNVVIITAQDDMYKADKSYSTNLVFPQTAGAVLGDACSSCDISLLSTSFENDDFIIQNAPAVGYTFRQIIGWIAMLAVGNARINRMGYLEILSYSFDYEQEYHTLSSFANPPTIDINDIVITGIQTTRTVTETVTDGEETTEEEKEETLLVGSEGYVLSVENPLAVGSEEELLQIIANSLNGFSFRKFSGDYITYPLAEFMDLVEISDWRGNKYRSFLTDVNFVFFGFTNIKNNSASALQNSSTYASNPTDVLIKAKELIEKEKTDRQLAIDKLSGILGDGSGMYITEEKQADGSTIYYMHNKPTLEESDIVWKLTAEAFGISTDGGKTYPYGFAITGELITRLLYAVGIDAEFINTGALTVKDDDGNIIFSVDIDTKEATFSGTLNGATGVFSGLLRAPAIEMYSTEVAANGGTSSFYMGAAGLEVLTNGNISEIDDGVTQWDQYAILTTDDELALKSSVRTTSDSGTVVEAGYVKLALSGEVLSIVDSNGVKLKTYENGIDIPGNLILGGSIIANGSAEISEYLVVDNSIYLGAKKAWNDGLLGSVLGNGSITMSRADGARILFCWNDSTSATSTISETASGALKISASAGTTFTGNLYMPNNSNIRWYNASGAYRDVLQLNSSNNTVLGYGGYYNSEGLTNIYGNGIGMYAKDSISLTTSTGAVYLKNRAVVPPEGDAGIRPYTDKGFSCGHSSYRWSAIYNATSAISTSDRTQKKDFRTFDSDERYDKLFLALKPTIYKFIDGTSGRDHFGFIAQDIEQILYELGFDDKSFAGFCKDVKVDENENPILDADGNEQLIYSLRYEEFISLNTYMIQKLYHECMRLKKKINLLKNKGEKL